MLTPRMPMAAGTFAAAPRPDSARRISNAISLGLKAVASEVAATHRPPSRNTSRFPYMSPTLPQSRRKQPNVRA